MNIHTRISLKGTTIRFGTSSVKTTAEMLYKIRRQAAEMREKAEAIERAADSDFTIEVFKFVENQYPQSPIKVIKKLQD